MFLRYWCGKGKLQGYPCIDKEPNARLGVRVSIRIYGLYSAWHSICVFSASIATDFFFSPPFNFFIYLKAAAGRELAMNSVLMILKDATGFIQTNFEEAGECFLKQIMEQR